MLKSDLSRHFKFGGQPERVPRALDLWRNFLHPRCAPLGIYRVAHALQWYRAGRPVAKLLTWINFFLFGIEIDARCPIGPGCYLPHAAGTVIGARSIGASATIYHQVTLGARKMEIDLVGRPSIGDDVVLGAGAKVLGHISVGDGCVVAPNSLLLESIPAGVTVMGVPAIVVKTRRAVENGWTARGRDGESL